MPWDSIPGTETGARPRISLEKALQQEFPDAVAIDASLSKGRAYLALRGKDGEVRPVYMLLTREEGASVGDDPIFYEDVSIDESPPRWPMKVARALTTWKQK